MHTILDLQPFRDNGIFGQAKTLTSPIIMMGLVLVFICLNSFNTQTIFGVHTDNLKTLKTLWSLAVGTMSRNSLLYMKFRFDLLVQRHRTMVVYTFGIVIPVYWGHKHIFCSNCSRITESQYNETWWRFQCPMSGSQSVPRDYYTLLHFLLFNTLG